MQNIILIGAGGHCKACIDVIEKENKYNIIGLVDLGNYFLITIGQITSPEKRIKMYDNLKKLNAEIATVISPLSYVSKHSSIDEGTIVLHDVVINANVKVGKNCIINTKSLLEHDVVVNDNCLISTGAIVNGGSLADDNTFVGSGSVVVHNVKIDKNSFIRAQSLIRAGAASLSFLLRLLKDFIFCNKKTEDCEMEYYLNLNISDKSYKHYLKCFAV